MNTTRLFASAYFALCKLQDTPTPANAGIRKALSERLSVLQKLAD